MPRPRFFKAWIDLRVLPRAVWWLALASFVNRLGAMALPFLTLYLVRAAHLEVSTAGLMLVVYGGVALAAGPFAGRLCDRFGPPRVMIGSLAASGIALCMYPAAHSVPVLIALTAFWSLSAETFRPACLARLTAVVRAEDRKQAFALHRLAVNLGLSVGPAAAGFIAQTSFAAIFIIDGATSLLAAMTFVYAGRREPSGANAPPPRMGATGRLPFRALTDRRLIGALMALFPLAVLFFQNESSVPIVLVQRHHFSPAVYGAMFTLNTVVIVFFEIPLNAGIAKWSQPNVLALGALFAAVGFAGVAASTSLVVITLMTLSWTIGEMLYSPAISTYIAEIAPHDRQGEYLGLYSMTYAVAFIASPSAGLYPLEHFGPLALALEMGSIGLLAAVLFVRLDRADPKKSAAA